MERGPSFDMQWLDHCCRYQWVQLSNLYLVHISILSVGPRSSKHFANLFIRQGSNYNQSQTTRIELDEQDADSFPPFGSWHECSTVKVTCWQSTNSSLSDSSLPLPRASQEKDRRRRWWGAWNWRKSGCDGQAIYFAFSNYWLAVKSNITHDPMCSLSKRWRNNLKGLWLWINWYNCNS